jgi:hypothetical protein
MPRSLFATVPSDAVYPRLVLALVDKRVEIEEARFCAGQATSRFPESSFQDLLKFAVAVSERQEVSGDLVLALCELGVPLDDAQLAAELATCRLPHAEFPEQFKFAVEFVKRTLSTPQLHAIRF